MQTLPYMTIIPSTTVKEQVTNRVWKMRQLKARLWKRCERMKCRWNHPTVNILCQLPQRLHYFVSAHLQVHSLLYYDLSLVIHRCHGCKSRGTCLPTFWVGVVLFSVSPLSVQNNCNIFHIACCNWPIISVKQLFCVKEVDCYRHSIVLNA